jgi:Zn-dependent protease
MHDKPDEQRVRSESPADAPPARPSAARLQGGSLRLFRVAGIDVFVHWTWLLVAFWRIQSRASDGAEGPFGYTSPVWYVVEYLAVFGIVLLHEFGHALACRSVGGRADRILLWPLGGVALVAPPPRPGAVLWSLVAGPLVNVLLLPPTIGLAVLSDVAGWGQALPDFGHFLVMLAAINGGLLVFNLLPIYPLDGGQILQALLWFVIGRARSLMVATAIGLVTGLTLLVVTLFEGWLWMSLMAAFAAFFSLMGFRHARLLLRMARAPRRKEAACPSCGAAPPVGEFWQCPGCRGRFDVFAEGGTCPACGDSQGVIPCSECGRARPYADWFPEVIALVPPEEDRGVTGG